jgi:membrane protease YdiL (CAAX protease family)
MIKNKKNIFDILFLYFDSFSEKSLFLRMYLFSIFSFIVYLLLEMYAIIENNELNNSEKLNFDLSSIVTSLFLIVLIGPIIETFFLQHLIIKYLSPKIGLWSIFVSSTIFGLLHSRIYVFLIFMGVIYSSYYYYLNVTKKKKAFWSVASLHMLYNLTLCMLMIIISKTL